MIIHELESPADELLKQGEELAQFVRQQQQQDGSIRCHEGVSGPTVDGDFPDSFAGLALFALQLSARKRPAAWKQEIVERAIPYYRAQWKSSPSPEIATSLIPAFAEAYVQTRSQVYADFVFEMSDWLCGLQYTGELGRPVWAGGFRSVQHGLPTLAPPTVSSAASLEAIAHACLVTRHIPDAARYAKYRQALEAGMTFLGTLQYVNATTLHFVPEYRSMLLGGFHASQQDGTLRLDYQEHAVVAMVQRLEWVGDR